MCAPYYNVLIVVSELQVVGNVHSEIVKTGSSHKHIAIDTMATKIDIEKFNGSNFTLWKMKM